MKLNFLRLVLLVLLLTTFADSVLAQSFGPYASAVWITDCNTNNFFNTSNSRTPDHLIAPAANTFEGRNFGVHTQNSGTLIFRGGEVKTFKGGSANVCGARIYYRVYPASGTPGAFSAIDFPFFENCNTSVSQFSVSGGPCGAGDQKWQRVIPNGATTPYAPVNLTAHTPGNYVLEVYYDVTGSSTSTTLCNETVVLNNGGANYKATFSIQAPTLSSTNPTTCNGTEGSITINGLVPGQTYQVSYNDSGTPVGPLTLTATSGGQIVLTGLNAGIYSNFSVGINGCSTNLATALSLTNPLYTPTFTTIPPLCAGATPPALPTVSNNGYTGTWSPATVSNTANGTYTFTPDAGQCAHPVSINVTVVANTTPTFSFGTSLSICSGGTVPTLPNTSTNGITGTWSPSTVSNTANGTYTFTPDPGPCAVPVTFTVTVTPTVTPSFGFGTSLSICSGGSVPTLPNTSGNGVTGTWSPATVSNTANGTYTFTPDAGQCATTATFTVSVTPNVTPTFSFGTSLSICSGGAVPALPNTSANGVTGTWSPATVSNTGNGTYTFTPAAGQCAITTTFTVTVTANIVPAFSFGTSLSICSGGTVPNLPGTSTNGITGTWSPATVSNTANGTYTFTPDAGQCATTATFSVTVAPNVTPTFSFGTSSSICSGGTVPNLPATSTNGITGTWSPATVSNTSNGTYTFTPTAGQCATTTTFTVTVTPNVTPTFSFGTSLSICSGGSVPSLPGTSTNGITGTWSPSTVSNTANGTYTFTPAAGQCATTATFTVTVTPNVTPAFSFGTSLSICSGGSVPSLPGTSNNGITGTWSPATVSNSSNGTYTFTPDAGQCATTATFSVTVNPVLTPSFGFGTTLSICSGSTVPALPATSTNGITGTWSPAAISNAANGTYTFTPTAGQCATPFTLNVSVTPTVTPVFSFGTTLAICSGGVVPAELPATSTNGITGTWSPATVSNTANGTYTFTPTAGQCATTVTFVVTVNPIVTPTFSFGTSLALCSGANAPALPGTSTNSITGTWSPATVNNTANGTYTFTPAAGQCANTTTLTVTVNPIPTVTVRTDTTVYDGALVPATLFTGTPAGVTYSWTNSNPAIGLASSGTGNVPSFTAINRGSDPIVATITVTASANNCTGAVRTYRITVLPLNKDVFVPNVFSPNGDGKNDVLLVYGNYIDRLEMRIFNQWGQQVFFTNSRNQGWDGTHKGKPQPVGVYVYAVRVFLSDGRSLNLKGSITLLR